MSRNEKALSELAEIIENINNERQKETETLIREPDKLNVIRVPKAQISKLDTGKESESIHLKKNRRSKEMLEIPVIIPPKPDILDELTSKLNRMDELISCLEKR